MIDQLKRALTTGVGLALKTWDEVETLGKEMVRKAKLPENEAANFLKGLKRNYELTQKRLEVRVNQLVKDVMRKANLATRDEVQALKREIEKLQKELKTVKSTPKAAPAKAAAGLTRRPAAKVRTRAKTKPTA